MMSMTSSHERRYVSTQLYLSFSRSASTDDHFTDSALQLPLAGLITEKTLPDWARTHSPLM